FLLENEDANGEAYNLCTGRATSVAEIAGLLAELYGRGDIKPEITNKYRSGDIRHCIGDPSKIAALGWRPRIALEDGLRELVAWGEQQEAADKVAGAHEELLRHGLIRD